MSICLCCYSCKDTYSEDNLEDLVMGLYFGMEKKEFYDHCWELNKLGKAHHGSLNNEVMYMDSVNFNHTVSVNFFPAFVDGVITELPMTFYYAGWAPWNTDKLDQDSLLLEVKSWLEIKFGDGFVEKKLSNNDVGYYKVDGPRTIRLYKDKNEMLVKADIKHKDFKSYEKIETK